MQAIRNFCERLKAFFTSKSKLISAIIDDSKIIDENTDDLEFHVPSRATDLELPSEEQTPSVPTQLPTALELLALQRLVCTATDTDTQHLDAGKPEDKQGVNNLD